MHGSQPYTVLVVEDNALNMKLMRDVLTANGYRVIESVDAESAIERAPQDRPDLILMDIKLPRMSGIDAILALKGKPETRNIPIVAVSSYALPGDAQKATQAGADGYLSKPVQLKELLRQVQTLMARPRREA